MAAHHLLTAGTMSTRAIAVAVMSGVLLALPEAAKGQATPAPACPAESAVRAPGTAVDTAGALRPPAGPASRDTADVRAGRATSADSVDIAIIASATVREIRFARQPEIHIRLCGGLDSVRVLERRNLPERIVAGQAYRDVYVAVEILGRIDAACLARKLGVAAPASAGASAVPDPAACAGIVVGTAASGASGTAPAPPRPGTEGAPAAARPPEPRR